ncbi:MAG: carboxypeptidase-like regulatory domain-containing protein [Salinivirgaceae bacterium]|jgi:hypothetical protein|nr:carboxypeptidase-like regulatory domain-containing protein [Bacteroidales bacterium]
MRIIAVLIFGTITFWGYSQETKIISGKIINQEGEGIPYSSIEFKSKKGGVACDNKGIYHWKIKNFTTKDTIIIRSMGYLSKEVPISIILDTSQSVILKRKIFELDEVVISSNTETYNKKVKIVGNNNKPKGGFGFISPGREIAIFIKDTSVVNRRIHSVSYFISNKVGIPTTPFRVRIYSVDKQTGLPSNDLLINQIVFTPKNSGWNSIQINDDITFPENGVFVSMEYIYTDEKYYAIDKWGTEYYGQYIGMSESKNRICRTFVKEFGLGWIKKSNSKYSDACIFIEVI